MRAASVLFGLLSIIVDREALPLSLINNIFVKTPASREHGAGPDASAPTGPPAPVPPGTPLRGDLHEKAFDPIIKIKWRIY